MESVVYKIDGSPTKEKVQLPKHVFGVEPNTHAIYLAVKAQATNSRQGTAATKTRSMVSGGGRKPWRQKGRGVARAGSTRSPLWVGGGRVFGPHPREYEMRLPRKVKRLARVSAYSDKAQSEAVMVVEDFKLEQGKTREMFAILKSLGVEKEKTLLLLNEHDSTVVRAGRNIPLLNIKVATTESTYDLLNCKKVIIQKSALDKLAGAFAK